MTRLFRSQLKSITINKLCTVPDRATPKGIDDGVVPVLESSLPSRPLKQQGSPEGRRQGIAVVGKAMPAYAEWVSYGEPTIYNDTTATRTVISRAYKHITKGLLADLFWEKIDEVLGRKAGSSASNLRNIAFRNTREQCHSTVRAQQKGALVGAESIHGSER